MNYYLLMADNNLGESQRHYVEWMKPVSKVMYCIIPFMSHSGRQRYSDGKQTVVDRVRVGEGCEPKGIAQGAFLG